MDDNKKTVPEDGEMTQEEIAEYLAKLNARLDRVIEQFDDVSNRIHKLVKEREAEAAAEKA